MRNADGSPNTAHTTNLVHIFYVAADAAEYTVRDGILADVAPTLLEMLGVAQPKQMTGKSLLVSKVKKAVKAAAKAVVKPVSEPAAKKRSVVKKSKGRGSKKWSR
jgi:arylsulfatase A-like enzyme